MLVNNSFKGICFVSIFLISNVLCKASIKSDTILSKKYLDSGIVKYVNDDYQTAIYYFELSIKYNSNNWRAIRNKALVELELNLFNEAIQDYSKAISINSHDTLSYKGRADAYRNIRDFKKALSDYSLVISLKPKSDYAYYMRGYCYYLLGNFGKSIDDESKAIQIDPNFSGYYFYRGIALLDFKKFREAVNDFNKYMKLGGENKNVVYYYRGRAYIGVQQNDSALEDLKKFTNYFPKDADGYRFLGISYIKSNDSLNARKSFERSINLNPNDPETYFQWGITEVIFANYHKSAELLEKAININKGHASYEAYYQLGYSKASINDTLGAIDALKKAIEIDPNRYDSYYTLMEFLFDNYQYNGLTKNNITILLQIFKDSSRPDVSNLYYLRSITNYRLKDTINTFYDINKSIELLPSEPFYYIARAIYNYEYYKNKKKFFEDIDKALKVNNKFWEAYFLRAALYAKLGENEKACEDIKRGVKYGGGISKEKEEYICKEKHTTSENDLDLSIYLLPENNNILTIKKTKFSGLLK